MYLLTLRNGRRAIYKGRSAENCFFVRLQGEAYWWWIPTAMVVHALELPAEGMRGAA